MRKLLSAMLCLLLLLGLSGCKEDSGTLPSPTPPEKQKHPPSPSQEESAPSQAQQLLESSPDLLPRLPQQSPSKNQEELLPRLSEDLRPTRPSQPLQPPPPQLPVQEEEKGSPAVLEASTSAQHLKRLIEQGLSPAQRGCVEVEGNRLTVFCTQEAAAEHVRRIYRSHPAYQDAAVYVSFSPRTQDRLCAIRDELELTLAEKLPDGQLRYHQGYVQLLPAANAVAVVVERQKLDDLQLFLASYDGRDGVQLFGRQRLSLPPSFDQGAASLRQTLAAAIPEQERGCLSLTPQGELVVHTPPDRQQPLLEHIDALPQGDAALCTVLYHDCVLPLAQLRRLRQELASLPQAVPALESAEIDPQLCRVVLRVGRPCPQLRSHLQQHPHRQAITLLERILP